MKIKYLYFSIFSILAGIILFTAFSANSSQTDMSGNKGLIKFSHKTHQDVGDCTTCHSKVQNSKTLGSITLPSHDDCSTCHDVSDEKNCTMCHYKDVFESLKLKKSELKFDHSFHLNKEKLQCTTCHKGIFDVAYAEDAPNGFPNMETCYSCHNNTKAAPTTCTTCHITTANLIPQSHKSESFISTHKFAARELNSNCAMCHDDASCEDCHAATTMIKPGYTPSDKNPAQGFAPYSPSSSSNGVKQQKLTRVHSLDYRFTHGIDAMGKTAECQSCHQLNTFCTTCHQSKTGENALGGIAPFSHLKSNFMIIGVGSGGGEHAKLARRDIESCAACHDVQGGDPVCIKCHTDPDGIQGTNPKTHPANYMKDVHGDWHNSDGSICFNCHTNTHQAGVGFCGYCHGSNAH